MKTKISLLIITLITTIQVLSADTKSGLIDKIFAQTGTKEIYEKLKSEGIEQQKLQGQQLFQQFRAQFSNLPKDTLEDMNSAFEVFLKECSSAWNIDDTLKFEKSLINEFYSESELLELHEFYNTPTGKKLIQSMHELAPKVQKNISEKMMPKMQIAMNDYIAELQRIISSQ